jgi:hypothetical protein
MGQIDLARINKCHGAWVLELAEVKSSQMGHQQMLRGQQGRISCAQQFLAGVFGMNSSLIHLGKYNP